MLGELAKKETEFIRFRRLRLTHNEFEGIKLIGRGAFGEVRYHYNSPLSKTFFLRSTAKDFFEAAISLLHTTFCCLAPCDFAPFHKPDSRSNVSLHEHVLASDAVRRESRFQLGRKFRSLSWAPTLTLFPRPS